MKRLSLIFEAVILAAVLLLAVSAEGAEPPKLPDGIAVQPADPAKVLAIVTSKESGRWLVLGPTPALTPIQAARSADGKQVIVEALPGAYLVILIPADANKDLLSFTLSLAGGKHPDPTPPGPGPGPLPPVPGAKLQIAFIVESSKLTQLKPSQQAFWGVAFREELEKKGHRFIGILEADQRTKAPANVIPFYAVVDVAESLPRVAVAPIAGGDVIDYPLPESPAALWQILEGK